MFNKKRKYHKLTDEALMRFITKGNEAAFNELYQRYHFRLYRYFLKMLRQNEALANDCLQELFIKVIEKAASFDTSKSFIVWLFAIASNICKQEYRKSARQLPQPNNRIEHPSYDEVENLNYLFKAIKENINELDENHKSCIVLRYEQNLSIAEISEILNLPEGTIKSRIFYAIKKLSKKMKPYQSLYHD